MGRPMKGRGRWKGEDFVVTTTSSLKKPEWYTHKMLQRLQNLVLKGQDTNNKCLCFAQSRRSIALQWLHHHRLFFPQDLCTTAQNKSSGVTSQAWAVSENVALAHFLQILKVCCEWGEGWKEGNRSSHKQPDRWILLGRAGSPSLPQGREIPFVSELS